MKSDRKGLITQGLIPDWLDKIFLDSVTPLIRLFSSIKINPNWITVLGFVQNVIAAVFIALERFLIAGLFIVIAGVFDFIDGKVAKKLDRATNFGAILDTVLDRYSDMMIYIGILLYYQNNNFELSLLIVVIAMVGSVMTSYIKALGDTYGIKFRMGLLRRQERITLICIGLVFTFLDPEIANLTHRAVGWIGIELGRLPIMPLTLMVYLLAIFTNFSALQRFFVLRKHTRVDQK